MNGKGIFHLKGNRRKQQAGLHAFYSIEESNILFYCRESFNVGQRKNSSTLALRKSLLPKRFHSLAIHLSFATQDGLGVIFLSRSEIANAKSMSSLVTVDLVTLA